MTTLNLTHDEDQDLRNDALAEAVAGERDRVAVLFHDDGSATVVVVDPDGEHANPRDYDGNVVHLIQTGDRYAEVDDDDAGLSEARERFHGRNREQLMARYIAMFRDDIAAYEDYLTIGSGYGYAYVTRADWEETGCRRASLANLIRLEADEYAQWANGEVYGGIHIVVGEPIVEYADSGAHIVSYRTTEDSCWGFLGCDDFDQIAQQFTDSPIIERV